MILEPVMMNAGIVTPDDGYLAALIDIVHSNGALVAFDEVKTGFTVAAGGATEFYGIRPDIVCLAKALGGGLPVAAIGGTAEVMERIADGTYEQVGTFNGNPLGMAAARAALTDVLTPEAYRRFDTLREFIVEGCETAISERRPPRARRGHRRQGMRHVHRGSGAQLQRLPHARRTLQPLPLAVPAQRWGVPAAVGEGGTVVALGAAQRSGCEPSSSPISRDSSRRSQPDRDEGRIELGGAPQGVRECRRG